MRHSRLLALALLAALLASPASALVCETVCVPDRLGAAPTERASCHGTAEPADAATQLNPETLAHCDHGAHPRALAAREPLDHVRSRTAAVLSSACVAHPDHAALAHSRPYSHAPPDAAPPRILALRI